jgi:hypothetical protein
MAFSQPDETLSATNEDSLYNQAIDYLKSDIWQFRDAGVALLVQLNDLDTTQIIAILINSLKDEIDSPLSLEGAAGTYFTVSEYLKNKYCLELRKFGSVAKREILKRLVSAEGEFKSRFIILLGFLGDESYRDKIRQIYYDSNDGYLRLFAYIIRMDAAGALGMRGFKLKPDGDNYIIISEPDSGANRK